MIVSRIAVLTVGVLLITAAPPNNWTARGNEIVQFVREYFFDRALAEAWATKHADYAAKIQNEGHFVETTQRVLTELKASHTGYYPRFEPEHIGLSAIFGHALGISPTEFTSIGADFTPDRFARVVFAGGPAAKAGLRRGDRVLKGDDLDFHPVLSVATRRGQVSLTVQRNAGGRTVYLLVTPRKIQPKQEWLEAMREGSRIIEQNGKKVAYVLMFSCAGEEFQHALRDLIGTRLQSADALILDFRDGWGGCNPDLVNLFNKTPSSLTVISRDGRREQMDSQWRKPLVILINGGTRSGKEVVAHSVRKHGLGTLVGERTAGAVLAGRCFKLSDGSLLYLAVKDIEVDGERLEGRGVEPHVKVDAALPFANGADPQLDKAIEIASRAR
jgi:carboxyl-terminal processing protease